jgi:hypothetical protein
MRNFGNRLCFSMQWCGEICLLVASVPSSADQSKPARRIGSPHALAGRQYSLIADRSQYLQNMPRRQVKFIICRHWGDSLDQLRIERQILIDLLLNAILAFEQSGMVASSCDLKANVLCITV